jgi:hypothetical protein
MLVASIRGHDVIFTLFGVYSFAAFTVTELMLIGYMVWFDNKRRHLPTWLANLLNNDDDIKILKR